MTHFFDGASKELRKNIFLKDGTLFISDAWKGESELIEFIGVARRRDGIFKTEYLSVENFQKSFARHNIDVSPDDEADNNDVRNYAIRLLKTAYEENASDIHIADYGTNGVIQFRCLGMLRLYENLPGTKTQVLMKILYDTFGQQQTTTGFTPRVRQDGRIAKREYLPEQVHSIRVHTEPLECAQADNGTGCLMLLRLLYDRTSATGTLDNRLTMLGYGPSDIERFRLLTERKGTVYIAGQTGHGKSTLLKHIMEAQVEESPEKSLQSIEDPPEYPLIGVKQIMVNPGDPIADPAARSRLYIEAIAGAMRSDPDWLMIGEIRYPDAAVAAIDAALTGHSVWSTIHGGSALGILLRMVSLLNSAHYAAPLEYLCDHNVTAGLIYQCLVPVLCPDCKQPLLETHRKDLEYRQEVLPDNAFDRLRKTVNHSEGVCIRGKGCKTCKNVGFVEQTVAAEVIATNQTLLNYVRNGSTLDAYSYWRNSMGGKTYIEDAISKIEAGILDPRMTELRLGVPLNFDSQERNKC
ncbi:MAG: Flp pilus assembly complex ATPase component TadA [Deltaproteobacteria bacterium]|jgi:type II secretory ATPase GspE/PulE/Tfp pilus assembly ATPase PilB-like protein|nr:Flp pilus assembly complex ATPase component TadA [Deltaproteobacteria bacterium]